MSTFVEAIANQEARTANDMKARKSTSDAVVDLFFKIGASRGKNITPEFVAAYVEDRDLALRIAAWVRDVRGGAGERQLFRDILLYLENSDPDAAKKLADKVPELGRYDDLLVFKTQNLKDYAFGLIKDALEAQNGLAAKWIPRKGDTAVQLRSYLGWSPKRYRKTLVSLTKVVETQMCANQWDAINFSHVPSVASSRYKKAFARHTDKYAEYIAKLVKGDDPTVKVNAGAIYPYDIVKSLGGWTKPTELEQKHIIAQWDALPNYVGDANILALVDVSGSMSCPAGKNTSVTCMDVALSLGIYLADKNVGKFKDTFLTFSTTPELLTLKGNVVQKYDQMSRSDWAMSTDLNAAFEKILDVAVKGNVPVEEMPQILLILSDMQFDACVKHDDSAIQMIHRKYEEAGYTIPQVVFWNLNSHDNVPVKYNAKGAALVSGFSPSIMTSVLAADMEDFTPTAIMLQTIMNPRYDVG
jgi:hypothetical protein